MNLTSHEYDGTPGSFYDPLLLHTRYGRYRAADGAVLVLRPVAVDLDDDNGSDTFIDYAWDDTSIEGQGGKDIRMGQASKHPLPWVPIPLEPEELTPPFGWRELPKWGGGEGGESDRRFDLYLSPLANAAVLTAHRRDENGELRQFVRQFTNAPKPEPELTPSPRAALRDALAAALTGDEAERARAAGWTPPAEQPEPLPTTPGSVVEYEGITCYLADEDGVVVWMAQSGLGTPDYWDPDDLQGARVLYDAGTGKGVKR